jgi:hypothetical protein
VTTTMPISVPVGLMRLVDDEGWVENVSHRRRRFLR